MERIKTALLVLIALLLGVIAWSHRYVYEMSDHPLGEDSRRIHRITGTPEIYHQGEWQTHYDIYGERP